MHKLLRSRVELRHEEDSIGHTEYRRRREGFINSAPQVYMFKAWFREKWVSVWLKGGQAS